MPTTGRVPKYWKFIPNIFVWELSAAEMLLIAARRVKRCKATRFLAEHRIISYLADSEKKKKSLARELSVARSFSWVFLQIWQLANVFSGAPAWQESQTEKTSIFYYTFHLLLAVHLCLFAVWQSLAIANGIRQPCKWESFSPCYRDQWFPPVLIAKHFLYHENLKFP